jgi:hypothetical protein
MVKKENGLRRNILDNKLSSDNKLMLAYLLFYYDGYLISAVTLPT